MFDRGMNYLATSDRWLKEYGQGLTDLTGRNHYRLYPDLPEWWKGVHRRGLAGESLSNDEEVWTRADGSRRWLRWALEPWRGEDGVIGGIVISAEDITDRKRAEEELRRNEREFAAIFEESPFAIALTRMPDRVTVNVNAAFLKLFEYSRDEVVGQSSVDLGISDPGSQARLLAELESHGSVRDFEAMRTTKSGAKRILSLNVDKVSVGGARYLLTTIRDITELKEAMEKKFLAEVGKVLASTLDYDETAVNIANLIVRELADVCIVETLEGEGQAVRRLKVAFRDVAKRASAEALMRIPLDLQRPHLGSAVFETQSPLVLATLTPEYVESIVQSDEHRTALRDLDPSSLMAFPLVAHGRLVGDIVLIKTGEGRAYQEEDLRFAGEVARMAAMAVENARLYWISQRAIKARDDVLGIVAHDLRNPLHIVLLQCDLLRRPAGEPERRSQRPTDAIRRSVSRMNRLIQDLLDVSRMEAGHLTVERTRVEVGEILGEAIEALRPLSVAASVELQADAAQGLPDVWGDKDRLLQVFENLVGNALKFTQPGGRVTVGGMPRDGVVLFRVEDTGAGIAPEDLEHVFDPFWQGRKAQRRGAGLGLPIVKGIVNAHGGRVWVESTPGRGSTFFFTIPVAAEDSNTLSSRLPAGR